jgi:hypothetical protein
MKIEEVNELAKNINDRYKNLIFVGPYSAERIAKKLELLEDDEEALSLAEEMRRHIKLLKEKDAAEEEGKVYWAGHFVSKEVADRLNARMEGREEKDPAVQLEELKKKVNESIDDFTERFQLLKKVLGGK